MGWTLAYEKTLTLPNQRRDYMNHGPSSCLSAVFKYTSPASDVNSASGLLKEEMRRLGSLVLRAADVNKVPAGGALAVDRDRFSAAVTDTLAAMRMAKKCGARIIAITNVAGSTLAREADAFMHTNGGPEIAVASTKAFTTQLMCLYLIALKLAELKVTISEENLSKAIKELETISAKAEIVLQDKKTIQKFASRTFNKKKAFFIGRLADYAISMESALKLKEINYTHSEAFAAGELKHGPIALIDTDTLVVAICTQRALFEKMDSNIKEVKARGASVLCITYENEHFFDDSADAVVQIPETFDEFTPLLSIIPSQLYAYYCSVQRSLDPDKPRNLAKSVTVE